jgi:hypothetical protein
MRRAFTAAIAISLLTDALFVVTTSLGVHDFPGIRMARCPDCGLVAWVTAPMPRLDDSSGARRAVVCVHEPFASGSRQQLDFCEIEGTVDLVGMS